MFTAAKDFGEPLRDATALRGGGSRSLLIPCDEAINVNLHGASPWHPSILVTTGCSRKHETPTGEPWVSNPRATALFVRGNNSN